MKNYIYLWRNLEVIIYYIIYSFNKRISFFSFSEGENETYYYSTVSQLNELLQYLERDGEEDKLLSVLRSWYDEIIKQMAITKELTDACKGIVQIK